MCDLRLNFLIFSDDRCCDGGGGEEEGGAVRDHEEAGDQRRGEESPPPQHQSVQIGDTPFYGSIINRVPYLVRQNIVLYVSSNKPET